MAESNPSQAVKSPSTAPDAKALFLLADAALRDVIAGLSEEQLAGPAPTGLTQAEPKTLRDVVAAHATDEAWVPDMLAGRSIAEVGDRWNGDLLGDDAVASYLRINDTARAAVEALTDLDQGVHMSYMDASAGTYLEHMTGWRAFSAWVIGRTVGQAVVFDPVLVDGLTAQIEPSIEMWRQIGVYGPAVPVPADADAQTRLLGLVGFWQD